MRCHRYSLLFRTRDEMLPFSRHCIITCMARLGHVTYFQHSVTLCNAVNNWTRLCDLEFNDVLFEFLLPGRIQQWLIGLVAWFDSFYVRISPMPAIYTIGHIFKSTPMNGTQIHSARYSLVVTHPRTYRGRRVLNSVSYLVTMHRKPNYMTDWPFSVVDQETFFESWDSLTAPFTSSLPHS